MQDSDHLLFSCLEATLAPTAPYDRAFVSARELERLHSIASDHEQCLPRISQRQEEQLEWHRDCVKLGNILAIPAALFLCRREAIEAPVWLTKGATEFAFRALTGRLPSPRGRSNGLLERRRRDNIDSARHGTVLEIRERRPLLAEEVRILLDRHGSAAEGRRRELEKMLKWLGRNDVDTFECASQFLIGTQARGSASAVKRSFHIVEKGLRSEATRARYFYIDWEFEIATGIYVDTIGLANSHIFDT